MPRVTEVVSAGENPRHVGWMIWCPGCNSAHQLDDRWKFNGDVARPTFGPVTPKSRHSLLVKTGHHSQYHKKGDDCWCTFDARYPQHAPSGFACTVCHSYIKDGKIQFLGDCTHALKGKTVDLPDWDEVNKQREGK